MARNIDPFEGSSHHSPFYIFIFVVFIFPILFLMTVWERFGCSRFLPQEEPVQYIVWDLEVAYWTPKSYQSRNTELLSQLGDGWRDNKILSVRCWKDENFPFPEDSAGTIVKTLDPAHEIPKRPLVEIVLEFYQTGVDNPKFVMVKRRGDEDNIFDKQEEVMAVVSIQRGPKEGRQWDAERFEKAKNEPTHERFIISDQIGSYCFKLDGTGTGFAKVEGVAELMKLAESP